MHAASYVHIIIVVNSFVMMQLVCHAQITIYIVSSYDSQLSEELGSTSNVVDSAFFNIFSKVRSYICSYIIKHS